MLSQSKSALAVSSSWLMDQLAMRINSCEDPPLSPVGPTSSSCPGDLEMQAVMKCVCVCGAILS